MLPNFLKPYHTALSNLIRLGRKSDGGYVIDKRVISKTRAIITCGLEAEWSYPALASIYRKSGTNYPNLNQFGEIDNIVKN